MIVYSIIMFVIAGLFLAAGVAIYKGNTRLIHRAFCVRPKCSAGAQAKAGVPACGHVCFPILFSR